MEVLSFLLLIVLLIILFNQNKNITKHFQSLEAELKLLRNQLLKFTTDQIEKPEPVIPEKPTQGAETKPYQSIFTVDTNPGSITDSTLQDAEPIKEVAHSPKITERQIEINKTLDELNDASKAPAAKAAVPSFSERHPDIEKFIGENLINKIGIAVLVLGIGFFVKYAIDNNWVGPVGRVSIGILCGGILVAVAHKLRNSYKSFSSVLAGGGLAVFYFTITLAYHQFQLFDQTTAFVIMIAITSFAVALSLLYNKQELAIIALVGGFIAPFLVSTGNGNYKVLFTYLVILNSGLLAIAYNKAWRILNVLSFIFTVLLFGSWLILLPYNEPTLTFKNGFLFATIFYVLYFVINIAHNIKEKKRFISSDFGVILANTCLFFSAGIYCLNKMNAAEFKGLFSASMGIFNLTASYFLFRKQKVDTNIFYLLVGITLTFISVTAPIQLHGNYITLFWASEAVLLYWLSVKSNLRIIQYSSVIVWMLMLVSLLMDWVQLYSNNDAVVPVLVNKGFITAIFAAISTYLLFVLRNKESENNMAGTPVYIPGKNIFRICALLLLFGSGAMEINYQFKYYYPGTYIYMLFLLFYTLVFISLFTAVTQKIKKLSLHWTVIAVMLAACLALYLLSIPQTFEIQKQVLIRHENNYLFLVHWVSVILVASVLARLIQLIRNKKDKLKDNINFIAWVLCVIIIIYLSAEMHLLSNNIFYAADNSLENIQRIYIKTGLPILWGLCSFSFMWLGMHYKYRALRIISLSLFLLTLLKLFLFDIRNIPAGGKIAAFLCLGILLLVVSFMYQRLKKIIIDNEEKRN